MNHKIIGGGIALVSVGILTFFLHDTTASTTNEEVGDARFSETEQGFEEVIGETVVSDGWYQNIDIRTATSLPPISEPRVDGRIQWATYWQPMTAIEQAVYGDPIGPFEPKRVGIQVGHWQRDSLPEELAGLADNTGAVVDGVMEEDVMYEIAVRVKALLEAQGIVVDILPVTIPVDYQASAFVSLHADGSRDTSISGFKIAAPRTDFSGRSIALKQALDSSYARATNLPEDTAITRRMTGYYAFNWRRYDHAVHPQTPAVIVETGFFNT